MIRSRKHTHGHNSHHNKTEMDDGSSNSLNNSSSNHLSLRRESSKKGLGTQIVSNKTLVMIVVGIFIIGFFLESSSSSSNKKTSKASNNKGISLIPPEQDRRLHQDTDGQVYHLIFSTDCGTYQHWQSYLTFYRAMKVQQPGHVTRIASGCSDEELTVIQDWFDNHIKHMSERFHLHLTPHFSGVKDPTTGEIVGDYKFFNKPFGLKYWLEHSDLLDYDKDGKFPKTEDAIVILIDPDMSLLRPITKDFTNDDNTVIAKNRQSHILARTVQHGTPFAQTYGFGAQFLKLDLTKLESDPNSPLHSVTNEEGRLYYPIGPPYIATVRDMYAVAQKWTSFVPEVHNQYPHLLAEMFAASLGAIAAGLPHQLINSLMISDTKISDGEGWKLIDALPQDQVCEIARNVDYTQYNFPNVVHLCQRYSIGNDWFFGKRRIPHNIFDCEEPLFEEPPDNVATLYDFKKPPNAKESTSLTPVMAQREAFMVCHLTHAMNEAAEYYKRSACEPGNANLKKSRKVADLFQGKGK